MFEDFKDSLKVAQAYFDLEDDDAFDELYNQLDAHIGELEAGGFIRHFGGNPKSMDKSAAPPRPAPA